MNALNNYLTQFSTQPTTTTNTPTIASNTVTPVWNNIKQQTLQQAITRGTQS